MSRPSPYTQHFTYLLTTFGQPFTARELLERIRAKQLPIARATAFRLLDQALAAGKIVTVPHLGSERLYERAGPHHHHAICPSCETVRDAELSCTAHGPTEAVLTLTICQQCVANAA